MPAPRTASGSNANMIKIVVAIVALVSAAGLLAWQMGVFGGSGPSLSAAQQAAVEKQKAEVEAAKKSGPDPAATKPAGTRPSDSKKMAS